MTIAQWQKRFIDHYAGKHMFKRKGKKKPKPRPGY